MVFESFWSVIEHFGLKLGMYCLDFLAFWLENGEILGARSD